MKVTHFVGPTMNFVIYSSIYLQTCTRNQGPASTWEQSLNKRAILRKSVLTNQLLVLVCSARETLARLSRARIS